LFIYMSRDNYHPDEEIWKRERRDNYLLVRTLIKLGLFMLFGAFSIFIFIPIGLLQPGSYLNRLSVAFLRQFELFWVILFDIRMIALILLCTVLAFLLLFIPSTFWDTESTLSLDQWNSILYLLDPIFGTSITLILGFEKAKTFLMVITLIILSVAILLRFVHEKESKVNVLIFLDVRFGKQREILKYLSTLPEIRKHYWITGIADIMIKATFGSIGEFYKFLTNLGINENIKIKYDYISFVTKIRE
ncbi:MAG: hypothetical protein ACTSRA_23040, partial [Promethearchaeota archaeon]